MPFIPLKTPEGPAHLNYAISTPEASSSPSINPKLPTILFLHSEWVSQEIFEAQFSDCLLRKHFNLLSIEIRTHGQSTGPVKRGQFTFADAADDIHRALGALNIPSIHFFALSIGCHVALEFSHAHPEMVLSLSLCGLLPPDEPEEVAQGRLQVWDFWSDAVSHATTGANPLEEASSLSELLNGGLALLLSGQVNQLIQPMCNHFTVNMVKNWAGSQEKLDAAYQLCIEWLVRRRHFDKDFLSKFKCPIDLIRCRGDMAYGDPAKFEDFADLLRQAGHDKVNVHEVDGPHLANVINPEDVNLLLFKLAASASGIKYENAQSQPGTMLTPFTRVLMQYGYETDPDLSDVGGLVLESSYPVSEYGVKTLIDDYLGSP